jgi:hypothetical protein
VSDLKTETFRVVAVDYLSMYDRSIAPTDTEYTASAEQYEHWRDGIVWRARILLPGRAETGEGCSAHEAVQQAARVLYVREILRTGEPTRAELAARAADVFASLAAVINERVAACDRNVASIGQRIKAMADAYPEETRAINDGEVLRARAMGKAEAYEHAASLIRTANGMLLALHNAATTEPAAGQEPIASGGNDSTA